MGETLRKYRDFAPWAGMLLTLVINILAIGFLAGTFQQHMSDLDRRMMKVEQSDLEQNTLIRGMGNKLERIDAGVSYIQEAVKQHGK